MEGKDETGMSRIKLIEPMDLIEEIRLALRPLNWEICGFDFYAGRCVSLKIERPRDPDSPLALQ